MLHYGARLSTPRGTLGAKNFGGNLCANVWFADGAGVRRIKCLLIGGIFPLELWHGKLLFPFVVLDFFFCRGH